MQRGELEQRNAAVQREELEQRNAVLEAVQDEERDGEPEQRSGVPGTVQREELALGRREEQGRLGAERRHPSVFRVVLIRLPPSRLPGLPRRLLMRL